MPVLVSQNFDVQHGIVNGTIGTVKKIRYTKNAQGDRVLTSVIITVEGDTGATMCDLEENDVPVICDQVTVNVYNSATKEKVKFQRHQVAILPAFAMTAHRAQGQTMDRVIIDLESCKSIEAAYVMLSRAKSLEGILVLRPFSRNRISGKLSPGLKMELYRLHILALKTKLTRGSSEERSAARAELDRLESQRGGSTLLPVVQQRRVSRNTRLLAEEERLVLELQQDVAVAFGAPSEVPRVAHKAKTTVTRRERKRRCEDPETALSFTSDGSAAPSVPRRRLKRVPS